MHTRPLSLSLSLSLSLILLLFAFFLDARELLTRAAISQLKEETITCKAQVAATDRAREAMKRASVLVKHETRCRRRRCLSLCLSACLHVCLF